MTLGQAFTESPNAYSFLRIVLAASVIAWHAALLPRAELHPALEQLLRYGGVDGFFVLSGFLVVGSWTRRPEARRFVVARLARLLPAFWVCLAVTAFVLAPLAFDSVALRDQVTYVLANVTTYGVQHPIGDTPGLSGWGIWNLSLWSLPWEVGMYAAVLALGLRRWLSTPVLLIVLLEAWGLMLWLTFAGIWSEHSGTVWLLALPRLTMMFTLGALAWMLRDRIAVRGWWLALAAVVFVASLFTENFHVTGAPAMAYLLLAGGVVLGRFPALVWREDISYGVYLYGYPVQVVVNEFRLVEGWLLVAPVVLVLTVPLAWLSWRCVERPVMRWSRRITGDGPRQAGPEPRSGSDEQAGTVGAHP